MDRIYVNIYKKKMELFRRFFTSFALLSFYGVLCQSQEIFFNLKDPESNEVTSLGQENVVLVCHVSGTVNADITITNAAGGSVATNEGVGNCIEHTIPPLTEADGGNYMCQFRYFNNNMNMYETETKSLLLNVESGDQQCFRNGTSNQAFGVGDTLKLSCYCTSTINCNWIRTVVGSGDGFPIDVFETKTFDGDRRIIRVIIGPLTSNDTNERYDCYYGSLASERCSIGPTHQSSSDFVLNPVEASSILRECPKPSTGSPTDPLVRTPDEEDVETPTAMTEVAGKVKTTTAVTPLSGDGLLYVIIAGGVLLILCIFVVFLILVIAKRKRNVTSKIQEGDDMKTSSNTNAAYDAADVKDHEGSTRADVDHYHYGTSSTSVASNHTGDMLPQPDVISYPAREEREIAAMSHYGHGVSKAMVVDNDWNDRYDGGDDVDYARVNRKVITGDMSQYGVLNAVIVGVEEDEDEDAFCSGDITEYGVPVAFRADGFPEVLREKE